MMKGGIAGLMKQAQQMQENMKKAQEQLATIEVEGQSGAGLVKVVMTCKHDVRRVSIDPSLLADDKDMLEDLVAAAVNDAVRRVEATVQEKMSGFTSGLNLPPGMREALRRLEAGEDPEAIEAEFGDAIDGETLLDASALVKSKRPRTAAPARDETLYDL